MLDVCATCLFPAPEKRISYREIKLKLEYGKNLWLKKIQYIIWRSLVCVTGASDQTEDENRQEAILVNYITNFLRFWKMPKVFPFGN